MAIIYCIENKINNKKYIGQSILTLNERITNHLSDLRANKHFNYYLQREFNLYKEESFIFYIVKECLSSELDYFEDYYVIFFDTQNNEKGYNLMPGGSPKPWLNLQKKVYVYDFDGNYLNLYYNSTRETSRELKIDQTLVFNICNGTRNKKTVFSNVLNKIIRFSYELIDKLPKVVYNKGQKEVYQYDLDMNLINCFSSMREAERQTGISNSLISRVCSGQRKTTNNFIFKLV